MRLFVSLLFLALASCSATTAPSSLRWDQKNVSGLTIDLIDPEELQYMSFNENGWVSISLGTKKLSTAPIYRWRIIDGKLQIYSHAHIEDELTLIKIEGSVLTARRASGKISRYKILTRGA